MALAHCKTCAMRTRGWLMVVLQFVLLIALVLVPRRPAETLWLIVGAVVALIGLGLGFAAFRALGPALTPTPVPIEGAGLRTTGVYARLRHPIYSAVLLLATGYVIAVGSWWSFAVALILLLFFLIKARWEDTLLAAAYPATWPAWAQRTGMLLPRMRR